MKNLLAGVKHFSETIFPSHKEHFTALASGQKPHTLLITCSDSRIDPCLVTQTKPGEIFIVRNAGNIIPPYGASRGGEEAAIEFAIEALGVRNIVICGHSQCGAMSALNGKVDMENFPAVKSWLKHAHGTKKRIDGFKGDVDLNTITEENVLVQADNLRTHPSVSAALRSGQVQIFGWVYNFETGAVLVYSPRHERYLPSTELKGDSESDIAAYAL